MALIPDIDFPSMLYKPDGSFQDPVRVLLELTPAYANPNGGSSHKSLPSLPHDEAAAIKNKQRNKNSIVGLARSVSNLILDAAIPPQKPEKKKEPKPEKQEKPQEKPQQNPQQKKKEGKDQKEEKKKDGKDPKEKEEKKKEGKDQEKKEEKKKDKEEKKRDELSQNLMTAALVTTAAAGTAAAAYKTSQNAGRALYQRGLLALSRQTSEILDLTRLWVEERRTLGLSVPHIVVADLEALEHLVELIERTHSMREDSLAAFGWAGSALGGLALSAGIYLQRTGGLQLLQKGGASSLLQRAGGSAGSLLQRAGTLLPRGFSWQTQLPFGLQSAGVGMLFLGVVALGASTGLFSDRSFTLSRDRLKGRLMRICDKYADPAKHAQKVQGALSRQGWSDTLHQAQDQAAGILGWGSRSDSTAGKFKPGDKDKERRAATPMPSTTSS